MVLMRYFLLIWILFISYNQAFTQAWELKKEGDSIKVYTRVVPNSPIKEFKASGTMKAKPEAIYAVLRDVPSYPKWIEDVKHAIKISEYDSGMTFYYQLALPWPLNDRDMALEMKITSSENTILFALESNPELVAVDEDFIRMVTVTGEWSIQQLDDEFCLVEHRFLADPEGSLPSWVVNMFIVDGPYQTMANLSEYLQKN